VSLATYHKKRHFARTPEPRGKQERSAAKALQFVVQKHDASRLHYDFRLELDGVLKSWAVPKGPSLDPSRKVLAVQVEDHPIDYGDFEGVIPKGEYGGGTVLLWDTGTWTPLHDPAEALRNGRLHFELHGKKLKGEWSLVRMHGPADRDGKNWLLMKLNDSYASKKDILEDAPQSVKTSRSIKQIAGQRDDVWSGSAKKTAKIAGATKAALPRQFAPQLAVLADAPPTGDEWIHEIKFDGYRIIARIENGKVTLLTRNGHDWTHRFPDIAKALEKLKVDSAIIDGEAVVLDGKGRSDFQALQMMLKNREKADPVYYAFDMPFSDGVDLRNSPLLDRKKALEALLKKSKLGARVQYSEHIVGNGDAMIGNACKMDLEGIISKLADSPYVSRRDPSWLKSKCGNRQEFIIIGFTDPQGARHGFGSLLMGYHNEEGQLVYAGRVGTGFDVKLLADTKKSLDKLARKTPPTDVDPPKREQRDAHWIEPKLVAEIKFAGWTRDGLLRQPAFVAFRSDKPADQIVREKPVKPSKVRSAKNQPTAPVVESNGSVAGVKLTHPDKIFWADSKTTKQQLADYYLAAQEWMTPQVVGRPLALVRCPEGAGSKCFFQRNWSNTLPKAVGKIDVGEKGKHEEHVTVSNIAGIISLAQIGVLEIHTWNCTNDDIEHPDQLVFDLDPGPGVTWKQLIEAARTLNKTLEALKLPTFLKTSGGKGLHLTIPIEPNVDWDRAKAFTETIAKSLVEKSDLFVANMRKDLRGGKVYIDYNRNGRGATAVAPYSTRARAGAPIAMPISWKELGKMKSANHFRVDTARRYLEKRKTDPWQDFSQSRVDLRKVIAG